jgi:hypothetical protein
VNASIDLDQIHTNTRVSKGLLGSRLLLGPTRSLSAGVYVPTAITGASLGMASPLSTPDFVIAHPSRGDCLCYCGDRYGQHRINRKLAAILVADVVGYSRLMGADEAGTLAALKRYRDEVFNPAVAAYNGRIVKLMGDGAIVEFASVVDAVNCALSVKQFGSGAPSSGGAAPHIVLRIGINLGDVIVEGDDIYGDGVSIAARGIRMTARRNGDEYVINGTKTWISNGINGSVFALLVKTAPEAQPRHTGMSLFIAEKGPGFTVSRKLEKLGYKSIDSAELVFDDYRVSKDNLIGGAEGQGFYQATGGLELGRINVAARGVGIAEGALSLAVTYAGVRKTFGKLISEHQAIQLKLAEMATRARAARLLTLDAADKFDSGQRCDLEAGMAKYFSSEAALENSIESMRIHGAYGYSKEYDIERLYRDAPLTCIGEGTNEMQRIIIARQLMKRAAA